MTRVDKEQLIPHTYVIRVDSKGRVGLGESAWHSSMYDDKGYRCARSWVEPIREHMEQISIMAGDWDWIL